MWLLISQVDAQLLGFALPQPSRIYPRQAYMPPGDGHDPCQDWHSISVVGHTTLGAWQRVKQYLCFPCIFR